MSGEIHDLSLLIGGIRSDIVNLANEVRENKQETTREHRTVHNIVVATSEAVRNVARDVEYMKPLVDDYRDKKMEARGAAKLAGAMYVALGSTIALVASKAWDWLTLRPHP
jgi:hypothetical protein